jgi:hypothetical protein
VSVACIGRNRRLERRLAQRGQELQQATTELAQYRSVPPMADGLYAIGEIRLRCRAAFAPTTSQEVMPMP